MYNTKITNRNIYKISDSLTIICMIYLYIKMLQVKNFIYKTILTNAVVTNLWKSLNPWSLNGFVKKLDLIMY